LRSLNKKWDAPKEKYLKVMVFANANANRPITQEVFEAINSIVKHLPIPQNMPFNALRHLKKNQNIGLSYYGGWSMGGDTIKVSSRIIVEILAGNLNVDKFIEDRLAGSSGDATPFPLKEYRKRYNY
jgi:hypothetical protein